MSLENLIEEYKKTPTDELFTTIYRTLESETNFNNLSYIETVAASINVTVHEIRELFDDCVLYTINNYDVERSYKFYFLWKFKNMRANYWRDQKTRKKVEIYESFNLNEDAATSTFEVIADETNIEEEIIAKRKADQLALIDFLVSGADDSTIGVVETALSDKSLGPKLKPTAIGRQLNVHHSKVTRSIERLAGNFDSKKFGDYRDYLVAL